MPSCSSSDVPFIVVRPWDDPLVEAQGFGPTSAYLEQCWLPVLGPSATWLYRRLGMLVIESPAGARVDLLELSQGIGLGRGLGRHAPVVRALGRLVHFGAARPQGSVLLVRRALARLPERHLQRLSPAVRSAHRRLLATTEQPEETA